MAFYVYILKCSDNSYYTGHTDDLERRIAQHAEGIDPACFTFKRRPLRLVYRQEFATREEALSAEQQIKGWNRAKKEALLAGDWNELARLAKAKMRPSTGSGRTGIQEKQLVMDEVEKPVIAVSMGDPSGIGAEIVAAALADAAVGAVARPLVLGDRAAIERGIAVAGVPLAVETVSGLPPAQPRPGVVYLRELSRLAPDDMVYGRPSAAGGDASFRYICEAARLCLSGDAAAMATAPINKESMNKAGHHYPGHTELLAEFTGADDVVMMLAGDRLRVTLVTIHEALSKVPELVTFERVLATIRITHDSLSRWFCEKPRLAVLALNPHCGEGGLFGDEESRIIAPAVAAARAAGIDAVGPLSADTLFHFAAAGGYDAVVCMYHDQGLIPLKLLHFDDGVNVSLGLPIIRTSVDHGTAYDLAGTGRASAASMKAALLMAAGMAEKAAPRVAPAGGR